MWLVSLLVVVIRREELTKRARGLKREGKGWLWRQWQRAQQSDSVCGSNLIMWW